MNLEEVKQIEDEKEDILFESLISVSLRTLFYLFLFISLSINLFCFAFPYRAMNLFYELNKYPTALSFSERSIKRESGDKYLDSLTTAIELSDYLLTKKQSDKYALKLLHYTEMYAFDENFDFLNKKIDDFNQTEIALITSNLVTQLSFFSYKDYVYVENLRARIKLNISDKLLINNSLTDINNISNEALLNLPLTDLAIFYNQASLLNQSGIIDLAVNTVDYYLISTLNESDKITKLYLLKCVYNLQQVSQREFNFTINGQAISLTNYFLNLLEEVL